MSKTERKKNRVELLISAMKKRKAAFFSSPTCSGKTFFMEQYFRDNNEKYTFLSCNAPDFSDRFRACTTPHIVIDDFQSFGENGEVITSVLAEGPAKIKLYLLSRGEIPAYLKPYSVTGQLALFDEDFFSLTTEEIQAMYQGEGKRISYEKAERIRQQTGGWYLGVSGILARDKTGDPESVFRCAEFDLYSVLDAKVWTPLPPEVRSFLLQIAHLDRFTEEEASMTSGKRSVRTELSYLLSRESFLTFTPPEDYTIRPIFHRWLLWKQENECAEPYRLHLHENTALYCVLHGDTLGALKFYQSAGNNQKISELLSENAARHPGNGYFYQMRKYYLALPDELVADSPEFLCALSMLHSVLCNPEESERYYERLKALAANSPDSSVRSTAKNKLIYLDVGLPHRGYHGKEDLFRTYGSLMLKKPDELQLLSVTGNMPSLMNGGLDFCEWSKRDRLLYKTLKVPVTLVLGKQCNGLAEIAIGESLFEKTAQGNFTEALTYLNIGSYEAQNCGNLQLEFAALAVLSRVFACQGKTDSAINLMEKLRDRTPAGEEIRQNMEAFLAHLYLLMGDHAKVRQWYEQQAPDEDDGFCILERYRYLTKVKIYLILGEYTKALSLLERLDAYFKAYARTYLHIEAAILRSILYFRQGDSHWKESLSEAIDLCESYGFIQVVAQYGAAILEPMRQLERNDDFTKCLLDNVQRQAMWYPKFLSGIREDRYQLTESEQAVLKLIRDGLTNGEIANLIGVSVNTVKFHLSNIYTKLNVKGRTEAINLCIEYDILLNPRNSIYGGFHGKTTNETVLENSSDGGADHLHDACPWSEQSRGRPAPADAAHLARRGRGSGKHRQR